MLRRHIISDVVNLIGQRFGKLVVLSRCGSTKSGRATWLCQCDCGNTTISSSGDLKHKKRPKFSCGCSRKRDPRFRRIWYDMVVRCTKKTHKWYPKYGGQGIKIFEPWLIFENFKKDTYESYLKHLNQYGKKDTTLDRIDSTGNYEPQNIRWATIVEQNTNKKCGNMIQFEAIYIEKGPSYGYREKLNNQKEFARKYNLNRTCIGNCLRGHQKIHRNWIFIPL